MTKISILIPVRRDNRLQLCLNALNRQQYPKDQFEVVVVENDSAPRYRRLVESFGYTHIQEEQLGIGSALRSGQEYCTGEILARLDADCVPVTTWLNAIKIAFEKNQQLGIVGGPVPKYKPQSWIERNQRELAIGAQTDLQYLPPISSLPYVVGANSAFRMIAFRQAGGYRSMFKSGDDVDLCWRIQYLGYEISHQDDMVAYHHCRTDIRSYCRSFYHYAVGHALLFKMHRGRRNSVIGINWYPKILLISTLSWSIPKGLFFLLRGDSHPIGKAFFDLLEVGGLLAGGIVGAYRHRVCFF